VQWRESIPWVGSVEVPTWCAGSCSTLGLRRRALGLQLIGPESVMDWHSVNIRKGSCNRINEERRAESAVCEKP
jgi:hypothetical protein